jgi:hypothetical protein
VITLHSTQPQHCPEYLRLRKRFRDNHLQLCERRSFLRVELQHRNEQLIYQCSMPLPSDVDQPFYLLLAHKFTVVVVHLKNRGHYAQVQNSCTQREYCSLAPISSRRLFRPLYEGLELLRGQVYVMVLWFGGAVCGHTGEVAGDGEKVGVDDLDD